MHTPLSASTCIMHSSSPTRTAQKYRTSRSHLHKYSEHEGLISEEKNIYCQILWESVLSVHVTFSFDPISNPTWEKLPESSEGFFFLREQITGCRCAFGSQATKNTSENNSQRWKQVNTHYCGTELEMWLAAPRFIPQMESLRDKPARLRGPEPNCC